MKPSFKVVINWKHNSPDLEFRYLDKERAEKIFKNICGRWGNVSYFQVFINEVDYLIDLTGISYVELKKDVIVDEDYKM